MGCSPPNSFVHGILQANLFLSTGGIRTSFGDLLLCCIHLHIPQHGRKAACTKFNFLLETELKVWKDNKYLKINSKLEHPGSVVLRKSEHI